MHVGSSRRGAGVGFVVAVLAAAGIASAASGAYVPPSGDIAAINFLNGKSAVYTDLAGATIIVTGYFSVRAGAEKAVDYSWGVPPPAGYVPATATILARLSGGKIIAYLAELRARGVRPLRIAMGGGVAYTSTTPCWRKTRASASPLGTGGTYMFNYGGAHFLPLKRNGATTAATFTYNWAQGAPATETNTFSPANRSAFKVTVKVTGALSLSFRKSITPLVKAPTLPVPPPPHQPVPKPLCTAVS